MLFLGINIAQAQDQIITKKIDVSFDKTTFIVFGAELDFYDVGSEDVLFEVTSKPNIVKLKGAVEDFRETNITIITKGGEYYSLIVSYNENPNVLNYIFTKDGSPLMITKEDAKEEKQQESLLKDFDYVEKKIASESPTNGLSTFAYRMGLAVSGVYVYKGNIYMSIVMTNRSSIDYNVDALMYSIQPRRKNRRNSTASQDIYMQPIHTKNLPSVVKANDEVNSILICFEPFTISNDNVFNVQAIEKEGSRTMEVKLQSRHLLSAKIIR